MGFYYIDEKYLLLLSSRLPLFQRKDKNIFNHRCTFCGDSQKNPTKRRGYHFEHKGILMYKCWNCGKACSTAHFIRELDPELYKEYCLEVFKEGKGKKVRQSASKATQKSTQKLIHDSLFDVLMDNTRNLPLDHIAVKMLINRKIPKKHWNDLYYLDDMRKIAQLKDKYKEKLKVAEPRLVITYRNRKGHVIGITCRSFEVDAKLRYISIPLNDDHPQVYGYDRVDLKKKVYVVEGAWWGSFANHHKMYSDD